MEALVPCGKRRRPYLFKLRLTKGVKRAIERAMGEQDWQNAGAGWQGKEPKWASPRISHGCCSAAKPSKYSHSRGEECLEVCWLPGATSTASTSRRLPIM